MPTAKKPSALITGAQSGLGKATAEYFIALGYPVIPVDKNNCDVTDYQKLSAFIRSLSEVPRIWVHCAGISFAKKILQMTSDEYRKVIEINLIGTFNVNKCAAEVLANVEPDKNGERGVIINTASIAAYDGQIGQSAYSASKSGVVGMTLPLARELAELGIRVMTISPGIMETPMFDKISEKFKSHLISSIPFPHRLGKPEEYAKLVQHIVENHYLNGAVIRLDAALRMAAK